MVNKSNIPLFAVEDCILVGRSLGTGPAAELAAYTCEALGRKPAALVLISAFQSLSQLVRSLFGKVAGFFIRDRF